MNEYRRPDGRGVKVVGGVSVSYGHFKDGMRHGRMIEIDGVGR